MNVHQIVLALHALTPRGKPVHDSATSAPVMIAFDPSYITVEIGLRNSQVVTPVRRLRALDAKGRALRIPTTSASDNALPDQKTTLIANMDNGTVIIDGDSIEYISIVGPDHCRI